jgi:hypothetical protein
MISLSREREEDSPTVLTLPKRASSYVQQLNNRPPLTRRIPITTSTKTAGSQQQLSLKTGMQSSPSQTTTTPTNTTPAHSQMNTNNTTTATTAALGEVGRVLRRLPTFGTLGRIAPTQQFYQQQQHQWIFSLLSWHATLENSAMEAMADIDPSFSHSATTDVTNPYQQQRMHFLPLDLTSNKSIRNAVQTFFEMDMRCMC